MFIILFLANGLYNSNLNVNDEIVKCVNDALIELKKYTNRNNFPENENSNKVLKSAPTLELLPLLNKRPPFD